MQYRDFGHVAICRLSYNKKYGYILRDYHTPTFQMLSIPPSLSPRVPRKKQQKNNGENFGTNGGINSVWIYAYLQVKFRLQ